MKQKWSHLQAPASATRWTFEVIWEMKQTREDAEVTCEVMMGWLVLVEVRLTEESWKPGCLARPAAGSPWLSQRSFCDLKILQMTNTEGIMMTNLAAAMDGWMRSTSQQEIYHDCRSGTSSQRRRASRQR